VSLTVREHRLLEQIAVALTVTDPALAAQLARWPTRPQSVAAGVVAAATAMAVMMGGLPLTLASPVWGCALSISGFIALSAAAMNLTRWWYLLPGLLIRRRRDSGSPTSGQYAGGGSGR
jgi:hypothetical protein